MAEKQRYDKALECGLYAQMLCDPQYAEWRPSQFAEHLEIATTTIYAWDKKIDWEMVKSERRKRFARPTMEVDLALFRQAKKGDVQAIRTWYERFDFWTPTQRIQQENKISDIEIEEAIRNLVERKRAAESGNPGEPSALPDPGAGVGKPGGEPTSQTDRAPTDPPAG